MLLKSLVVVRVPVAPTETLPFESPTRASIFADAVPYFTSRRLTEAGGVSVVITDDRSVKYETNQLPGIVTCTLGETWERVPAALADWAVTTAPAAR